VTSDAEAAAAAARAAASGSYRFVWTQLSELSGWQARR
jgi:hypothetical protein